MRTPPTMLVLACRDHVVKSGSCSILHDVWTLCATTRVEEFNRFVLDVAAALEREHHDALAREARRVVIRPVEAAAPPAHECTCGPTLRALGLHAFSCLARG